MRISEHPILDLKRSSPVKFTFDGTEISAFDNETIAVALHAAGIRTLSHSVNKHRPRGLYCAIGNCSSCVMIVDGEANVKTCITLVQDGMVVESQKGKGNLQ
ncbi:MAG: (2Fe-2S)-binding protein [Defluviitaleaceae bacterium]|nr:(2Fe-2S)-binding protein [Defluviitaleaceae bacterium]